MTLLHHQLNSFITILSIKNYFIHLNTYKNTESIETKHKIFWFFCFPRVWHMGQHTMDAYKEFIERINERIFDSHCEDYVRTTLWSSTEDMSLLPRYFLISLPSGIPQGGSPPFRNWPIWLLRFRDRTHLLNIVPCVQWFQNSSPRGGGWEMGWYLKTFTQTSHLTN